MFLALLLDNPNDPD